MSLYVARRLVTMVLTLFGTSLLVFLLVRLVPGTIVDQWLGIETTYSQADVDRIKAYFGLDQPVPVQYLHWIGGVLQGNLDESFRSAIPVSTLILTALPVTAELAVGAMTIAVLLGVSTGVIVALHQNEPVDGVLRVVALATLSIPAFWLGTMLILVFSYFFKWAPPVTWVSPLTDLGANLRIMILPVVTLGAAASAGIQRYTRVTVVEAMRQDYIRTARSKGLSERRVVAIHALRNSLIPVVTVVGLELGALLGGAAVAEQVFTLPGLGRLVLEGIYGRDYPVVQGATLFIATAYIVLNFVIDVLYAYMNPRIRYS
jgi:peptide/nickel transport system permease protein